MTMHVVAAEIFVLSRAHVPLGTLQVPLDDFLNWTTNPVPLPLHDTSTAPDVVVLTTADTADAVPEVPVDADTAAVGVNCADDAGTVELTPAFVAVTLTVYRVPFVRPVTSQDHGATVAVHAVPATTPAAV